MVFRGRNKDTNIQYALKIFRRRYNKNPGSSPPEGDPSPTLTRSSGASIVSSKAMYPHSLGMKREREAKTYLHYIKAGHRYICNFEAWCEFDVRGDRRFLHVFELCDAGTLFDIVATYSEKKSFPPETFIVSNSLSLHHPCFTQQYLFLSMKWSFPYAKSIGICMLVADMCHLVESLRAVV
jgi:serine/threonine protein kinase